MSEQPPDTQQQRAEARIFTYMNQKHRRWAWGLKGTSLTVVGFSTRAEAFADGVKTLLRNEADGQ